MADVARPPSTINAACGAAGLSSKDGGTAVVSSTITITQVTPTVSWATPADITYGTALGSSQLNAAASALVNGSTVSLPGTFSYTLTNGTTPASGIVLHAGQGQALKVSFTPTDSTEDATRTPHADGQERPRLAQVTGHVCETQRRGAREAYR